jgi:lipopolysaccharide transport system ATP-binding protein
MTSQAIVVENLSKMYRLGANRASYRTFRESITNLVLKPFQKAAKKESHELWALNDLSFTINQGDAVAIVGNNGAGKSTLLKILSRITKPTSGKAHLNGRLGSLLEVGTGFHPELTGKENILLNGSILGMRRQEILKKFDEIVSFAEIERFLDTPVKHYSSGMYIRLAFSVAAHLEPEILIVDEVLAVGDVRFQKKCLGKMEQVGKSGRTVLFVSHNMSAIQSLCQKGILLSDGKMAAQGAIHDVVQTYMKSFQRTGSKRVWEQGKGPGNAGIEMLEICVQNQAGEEVDFINLSQEAVICFTYRAKPQAQAIFSLTLFAQDGTCVFSSMSNREELFHGKVLQEGIYQAKCHIYPNLLNNGQYFVSLAGFSSNWSDPFLMDRIINFEAADDGVLKGDYFGPFGGPVRPDLNWTVHRTC